jgi:hypothetical protein
MAWSASGEGESREVKFCGGGGKMVELRVWKVAEEDGKYKGKKKGGWSCGKP